MNINTKIQKNTLVNILINQKGHFLEYLNEDQDEDQVNIWLTIQLTFK